MSSPQQARPAAVSISTPQPQIQQPNPQQTPAPPQSVSKTSLSSMLSQARTQRQQISAEPKTLTPTAESQTVQQDGQASAISTIERVDPSKLWDAWQKYMIMIKQTNGQLYGSMNVGPQLSSDGITVEVRIASEFERSNIESNKELFAFLRKETGNNHLMVKAVIDADIAKRREVVYTATQKFDKMRASNSYLDTFMKKLGLIVD